MKYTDKELEDLWDKLGDICINDEEEIEEDFYINEYLTFEKGTERLDIWHWFDDNHSIGLCKGLLNL